MLDSLLILTFSLLFLFDNSLDPSLNKFGRKAVDAGFGVDGEAILDLEKLVGGIIVRLSEGYIGDGIDDFNEIIR